MKTKIRYFYSEGWHLDMGDREAESCQAVARSWCHRGTDASRDTAIPSRRQHQSRVVAEIIAAQSGRVDGQDLVLHQRG
jgi:hypothetical protein